MLCHICSLLEEVEVLWRSGRHSNIGVSMCLHMHSPKKQKRGGGGGIVSPDHASTQTIASEADLTGEFFVSHLAQLKLD